MDVTQHLASFAAGLTYDNLPSELRQRAKMFVLDRRRHHAGWRCVPRG